MTTTTSPAAHSRAHRSTAGSPVLVWITVALVIAAAAVIAVVVAASGDDAVVDTGTATAAGIPLDSNPSPVGTVVVDGSLLDSFPADDAAADPALGEPAPTITATYFDGTERTIDFADGTGRVLLFFAHWCPHCQSEVASLAPELATGLPAGVEVIGVSTAVDPAAPNYPPSNWLVAERWPTPVLRDSYAGELAQAFGLTSFPFVVGIDGNGEIVERHVGQLDPAAFDRLLERVRAAA